MDTPEKLADQIKLQTADESQPSAPKITLIEERMQVGVREIATSKVQIHKKVVSENVSQNVDLKEEEVSVVRKPINQYVNTPPEIRYEDNVTIVPVLKEVLVVEKRLVLVEELHITKNQFTKTETVTESLRKDEVEIIRVELNQDNTTSNQ